MPFTDLPYAKSGETPGAAKLRVLDADGEPLRHVVEASATEGWYVRIKTDPMGRRLRDPTGKAWDSERVNAPCRILQWSDDPVVVDQRKARAEAKRRRQAERQAKSMAVRP